MAMSRKKVLWADDEIEYLRSHIMFLETRGYSVTPVFNGDDALHILAQKPKEFDIVLLDEQMPGVDGLTVLEKIKESLPDLPVVMVTKSEEERVMEDALGMKIDGYLTKPVNPSQILSVCKRLLDSRQIISSQISQRFVRNFSEIKSTLHSPMNAQAWIPIYENLMKWDLELENVDDEGIRQAHAGQRSEANSLFSEYYVENYLKWIAGDNNPPLFTSDIVDRFMVPKLKENSKVVFIVFDCLRLDQYQAIEPFLRKHFDIEKHMYFANLPSTPQFTRPVLFGGTSADELSARHPDIYLNTKSAGGQTIENILLREKLTSCGINIDSKYRHFGVRDVSESQNLLSQIDTIRDCGIISININSLDMLSKSSTETAILKEMASDEIAFRKLTSSWFQYSNIYQILKELAKEHCTVILTACNGSVLCTRGVEIYGEKCSGKNLRFRVGENITCDQRHALFIPEPKIFKIPVESTSASAVFLKENFYFIDHDDFENYHRQYINTFQHGGISMEEIIVPLAILSAR